MNDLIDRQQAIDALIEWYGCEPNDIDAFKEIIYNKPSTQPDVPDTNVGDMISRQAAIDALDRIFDQCEEIEMHLPKDDSDRTGYKMYPDYMTVWKYLRQLPSAQGIIRCKDCKFTDGMGPIADGRYWCVLHESFMYFCSDAERGQ